jgi:hypothetical protein
LLNQNGKFISPTVASSPENFSAALFGGVVASTRRRKMGLRGSQQKSHHPVSIRACQRLRRRNGEGWIEQKALLCQ